VNLKNKRILITAGSTWVPIDNVRVISNIATGETGVLLAQNLQRQGAKVTLLLGPAQSYCINNKIRLIRFKFFDELSDIIEREVKSKKYDIIIHSAAVSDYKPKKSYTYKVNSGLKSWRLNLVPTPKIIDSIKKFNRVLLLVGFKFEPKATKSILIKKTRELIRRAHLDLAVANTIDKNQYKAYIINHSRIYGPMFNKRNMIEELVKLMGE